MRNKQLLRHLASHKLGHVSKFCLQGRTVYMLNLTIKSASPLCDSGFTVSQIWDGWEGCSKYLDGSTSATFMYCTTQFSSQLFIKCMQYSLWSLFSSPQAIYILHPTFHLKAVILALQMLVDNVVCIYTTILPPKKYILQSLLINSGN